MAWIEYEVGRRYDPDTGQAQWNRNGQWMDAGNVMYDQSGIHDPTAASGRMQAPMVMRDPQSGQLVYTPAMGGWANMLPSPEILRQIYMARQMQAGAAPAGAQTAGVMSAPSSYYGAAPQMSMGTGGMYYPSGGGGTAGAGGGQSTMTWDQVGRQIGLSPRDITQLQQRGNTPDEVYQSFRTTGKMPPAPAAPSPAAPAAPAPTTQPETRALQQMAQIDPTSEALRQGLAQSYLTNLGGGPAAPQFGGMPQFGLDLSRGAAAPAAGDVQSYLDLYKQIDPQGYAQRVALAGGMDQFVQNAQAQAALGAQLDPGTIREVEQGTRSAQAARGNVYGTPQLVAETMARGTAGEQRLLQRQQLLQSALGQQQSYLGAGLGLGDIANTLYNQGYNRYLQGYGTQANAALQGYGAQLQGWQAQQNARLQAQGAALGYLGSGQTPYQAGSSYLNMAQQNAAAAAQGGPQYNPASLGQQYTGAGAPSFPQYGLDVSQLAGNWYNNINQANLQAYGLGQAYGGASGGQRAMGAGIGALGGAASGALAGAAAGGVGAIPGAIIGGIGGAASGYFK